VVDVLAELVNITSTVWYWSTQKMVGRWVDELFPGPAWSIDLWSTSHEEEVICCAQNWSMPPIGKWSDISRAQDSMDNLNFPLKHLHTDLRNRRLLPSGLYLRSPQSRYQNPWVLISILPDTGKLSSALFALDYFVRSNDSSEHPYFPFRDGASVPIYTYIGNNATLEEPNPCPDSNPRPAISEGMAIEIFNSKGSREDQTSSWSYALQYNVFRCIFYKISIKKT